VLAALMILFGATQGAAGAGGAAPKAAAFERVRTAVADAFAREKGYEPGDFVTRKQVERVLDRLDKTHPGSLKREDRDRLVKSTVDDRSFLAEQLGTAQAKPFMREVAKLPGGFDLLDRMSQMSHGRSTVTRLVRGPDGYKLLKYMTEEKGGAELEKMLAKDPGNADFGKPTGKIYTAEQLLMALQKIATR
jgi:hypothetical protein